MNIPEHIKEHVALDITKPIADGNFLIPFGDSLTGSMWYYLVLSGSITTSSGIATVTSAATGIVPGMKVVIAGCIYAGFNGIKTVLSTPTATTLTFACDTAAPASETITSQFMLISNKMSTLGGCIHYLIAHSKARFYIPINAAVHGDDSTEALARLGSDVLAYKPNRVLVLLGTNNALAATPNLTTFISDMTAIYTQCLSAGIAVDACTIPPFGTGNALVNTTLNVNFILNANRWIREYVNSHKGMKLHDVFNWITDPAQTNGKAKANYLNSDGIHFSNSSGTGWLGVNTVGKNMAANYVTWLGNAPDRLPAAQSESISFHTSSRNKYKNPLMQGTAGTIGSGAVGASGVATDWTATGSGTGCTNNVSKVSRVVGTDGDAFGDNQICTCTSVSNNNGTYLVYQDPSAELTIGNTYKAMAAVGVTVDANVTQMVVELNLGFQMGGITRQIVFGLQSCAETGQYVFETPEFTVSGVCTSPQWYMRIVTVTPSGISAPVVSWGRVGLIQTNQ